MKKILFIKLHSSLIDSKNLKKFRRGLNTMRMGSVKGIIVGSFHAVSGVFTIRCIVYTANRGKCEDCCCQFSVALLLRILMVCTNEPPNV